jgi:hypothetical protein
MDKSIVLFAGAASVLFAATPARAAFSLPLSGTCPANETGYNAGFCTGGFLFENNAWNDPGQCGSTGGGRVVTWLNTRIFFNSLGPMNDLASSIIVFPGFVCSFSVNTDLGGATMTVDATGGEQDIRDLVGTFFQDNIDSWECSYSGYTGNGPTRGLNNCAVLFENNNFNLGEDIFFGNDDFPASTGGGNTFFVPATRAGLSGNTSDGGFNDQASSLIVLPGCTCTFWTDANNQGASLHIEAKNVEQDYSDLVGTVFQDSISSYLCVYDG